MKATGEAANRQRAQEAVEQSIRRVAPEAELAQVDPAEVLREALDLDSLDFLAVIEGVAAATGVTVPESDYAKVDTLARFVDYVAARS